MPSWKKLITSGSDANLNSLTVVTTIQAGDITADSFIKVGGLQTEFLKADGSVDANKYITSAELPTNLILYPTTASADIGGYFKLVKSLTDPDYNTTAVNISTGTITGTDQLISSLISVPNIIVGEVGVFNMTIVGNIRKTLGSGEATFHYRIFKRTAAGVETEVGLSSDTLVVTSPLYVEFSATAIWNDGVFAATDRIVFKFYARRIPLGSDPTYEFQFGGTTPVRSLVPIPASVIPPLYLEDLVNVEDGAALNNEGIFYNTTSGLWEHKLVSSVFTIPTATSTVLGGIELFSDTAQTVASNAISSTALRTYGLQVNAAGQGVVNVPWTGLTSGSVGIVELKSELKAGTDLGSVSGTVNIDCSLGIHYKMVMTGAITSLTFSNYSTQQYKTITLEITGNYTITKPTTVKGDWTAFDGTKTNQIQIYLFNVTTPVFSSGLINW